MYFLASKKRLQSFFLTIIMPGWPISSKKLLPLYCFPYLWTTFYLCTTFYLETTLGRTYRVHKTTLAFIAIIDFILCLILKYACISDVQTESELLKPISYSGNRNRIKIESDFLGRFRNENQNC